MKRGSNVDGETYTRMEKRWNERWNRDNRHVRRDPTVVPQLQLVAEVIVDDKRRHDGHATEEAGTGFECVAKRNENFN